MKSLFTIDVEGTIAPEPADSGSPFNSVDRLDDFLATNNLPVTVFATPAVVENRTEIVDRWLEQGVDLGLHVHPAQLADGDSDWLTDYDRAEIEQMVADAAATFEKQLSYTPTSFRAGRWEYSERLLEALDAQGFVRDSSYKPARSVRPYSVAGVREFPLTVYYSWIVRLVTRPWNFDGIPMTADAFLSHSALAVGFRAVARRLLRSDQPYLMVSYHDYDILDASFAKRLVQFQQFLSREATPVTLADL